jgi:hypothetical protein
MRVNVTKNNYDKALLACLALIWCVPTLAGLKVFGREFCNGYDAGACINFHDKNVLNAKNVFGSYKYPKGRKAFHDCARNSDKTDGSMAYCAMIFHREEQTEAERAVMCKRDTREKYWNTISGDYAMSLYDSVWNCRR